MARRFVVLTQDEIGELFRQDPQTSRDGGFQAFLVRLQKQFRGGTQEIRLEDADVEDIARYAFDYKNGGWQTRLIAIFGRALGPDLGRDADRPV